VDGGWFSTTGQDRSVLLRLKEDYDGAEPAASSVSVLNLLTLSHVTAGESDRIDRTLAMFGSRAAQMGRAVPMMLAALSTYHAGAPQILIVGDPQDDDTRALWRTLQRRYLPGAIVVPVVPQHQEALAARLPWTASMRRRDGRATAYVCRDFACQAPTNDAAVLDDRLHRQGAAGAGAAETTQHEDRRE
jgi:uncharacterized protein YyaL (SSP411 family)